MKENRKMFSYKTHEHDCEETLASIKMMHYQEDNLYRCCDYLRFNKSDSTDGVDTECRYKMARWAYQVVDFCNFENECVAYCMNYLDRFLMTPQGQEALEDRKIFQLTAMTCLYIAIKVHETVGIEPQILTSLSRGAYSEGQFEEMERKILVSIKWLLNPPTALSFLHQFLSLLPKNTLSEEDIEEIVELATFQIESAISSYTFVGLKASKLASAALKNSLQCSSSIAPSSHLLMGLIGKTSGISFNSNEIINIQRKLFIVVAASSSTDCKDRIKLERISIRPEVNSLGVHHSPRSVFHKPKQHLA